MMQIDRRARRIPFFAGLVLAAGLPLTALAWPITPVSRPAAQLNSQVQQQQYQQSVRQQQVSSQLQQNALQQKMSDQSRQQLQHNEGSSSLSQQTGSASDSAYQARQRAVLSNAQATDAVQPAVPVVHRAGKPGS